MTHYLTRGLFAVAVAAAALTPAARAAEKIQLQITPTVSIAPASVLVRVIVEHDQSNRQLEIVADSSNFYRRSVMDLDGAHAPKVNEIRLIAIPRGEYEVTATLTDSYGTHSMARQTVMVMGPTVD